MADVMRVVEAERGEAWAEFSNRHGDLGRELVLYLARGRTGLSRRQIGEALGIPEYKTVGKAVQRFTLSMLTDKKKRQIVRQCEKALSPVETPNGRCNQIDK